MKSIVISIAASSVLVALPMAQSATNGEEHARHSRYTVTDLGTLPGGTFSQATFVDDTGLVTGLATTADGAQHAVLWYRGRIVDIAKPGLGGPNSGAFGINTRGQALVQAETSTQDPNGENFCGYPTGLQCLPALWQNGVMIPLPVPGGHNGTVGQINNRGEAVGLAENGNWDPACPAPQVLDFEAVIWGPRRGEIRELRPLHGDTVAMAIWINDNGQAVGASGSCADTSLFPLGHGRHAVLWENDGSVHDLGNLGGTVNIALSINNQGHVVGASHLKDETNFHAFLKTRKTPMHDLGTLDGDVASGAVGINDSGEVVGQSFDASGNPHPFIWHNGVMTDLNQLVPASSPLLLLWPTAINAHGEISGFGVTSAGDLHGFLLTPRHSGD